MQHTGSHALNAYSLNSYTFDLLETHVLVEMIFYLSCISMGCHILESIFSYDPRKYIEKNMQISYDFHKKLVNLYYRFGPNEDLAIKSYGIALIFVCFSSTKKNKEANNGFIILKASGKRFNSYKISSKLHMHIAMGMCY